VAAGDLMQSGKEVPGQRRRQADDRGRPRLNCELPPMEPDKVQVGLESVRGRA